MEVSEFRSSFTSIIFLDGLNNGCDSVSGTLSIVLDSLVSYNSANPIPDSISGDTMFWNFSDLVYESPHLTSQVNVTTNGQIGDTVCFEVYINPVSGDADSSNNYKRYCFPVVNGYDPNDKQVYPPGACAEGYILNGQKLTYTVRFQNTGNSNAININVLDSLDSDLDLNSVRVISHSHPLITEVLPVNVLKFRFDNIMLPDSGANEPASHGYVIYEVDPLPSLPNYTEIKNHADIYFDFNPPVITNTVLNTIIDSIPDCSITTSLIISTGKNSEIRIYPNPSGDLFFVDGVAPNSVLKIYDYSGRLVMTQKVSAEKGLISTAGLENGIYLVEAVGEKGKNFSRIVIQK